MNAGDADSNATTASDTTASDYQVRGGTRMAQAASRKLYNYVVMRLALLYDCRIGYLCDWQQMRKEVKSFAGSKA